MKTAFVLLDSWRRASIDFDGCCESLAQRGHSPVMVCMRNDAGEAAFPVVETSREKMADPWFWRSLGLDAAFFFCWLRGSAPARALTEAGVRVVLRADNDGQSSVRVFPGAASLMTMIPDGNPVRVLRRFRHLARRYMSLYRQEDSELLATVEASFAVAIESQEAAANLAKIFRYYGRAELAGKIHVVPHSVSDAFLRDPVGPSNRPPRVYCGGRWDDPQKDARLLCRTIDRVLAADPEIEFIVAGPGIEKAFGRLHRHPRVRLEGILPKERIPSLLGKCRFLLSSSRWETQPIGALEALCMGASVVAPPLPGFVGLVSGGASGTLAASRNASSLSRAVRHENGMWERGRRSPREIAAKWRPRVSNDAVIDGLLACVAGKQQPFYEGNTGARRDDS